MCNYEESWNLEPFGFIYKKISKKKRTFCLWVLLTLVFFESVNGILDSNHELLHFWHNIILIWYILGNTSDLLDEASFSSEVTEMMQTRMKLTNLNKKDVVRLMGIKRTNASTLVTIGDRSEILLHSGTNRIKQSLSLIHIWRCRRLLTCRSRWSPYH